MSEYEENKEAIRREILDAFTYWMSKLAEAGQTHYMTEEERSKIAAILAQTERIELCFTYLTREVGSR